MRFSPQTLAVQVTARRAAVRARLPRRSWAGIISRMYRSGTDTVDPLLVFGPRLNCKNIDKQGNRQRVHVQKTWNKYARDSAYLWPIFDARCFPGVHFAAG